MKFGKRMLSMLLFGAVFCMLLTTAAFASEEPGVWLSVTGENDVLIVTNTMVTSGSLVLTYDSAKLSYEDIEINDGCVAMHAVNPNEAGIVRISWVATSQYEALGDGVVLFRISLSGTADAAGLSLSGKATDTDGNAIAVSVLDTSALEAAIAGAEALVEKNYTSGSYSALQQALTAAKAVLSDAAAAQEEVDSACSALQEALDNLVPLDTGSGNENNSNTGDNSQIGLLIVVMLVCAAGIVVLILLMKKKGGDEE